MQERGTFRACGVCDPLYFWPHPLQNNNTPQHTASMLGKTAVVQLLEDSKLEAQDQVATSPMQSGAVSEEGAMAYMGAWSTWCSTQTVALATSFQILSSSWLILCRARARDRTKARDKIKARARDRDWWGLVR